MVDNILLADDDFRKLDDNPLPGLINLLDYQSFEFVLFCSQYSFSLSL
jgi:hypothetical protein